MAAYIYAFSGVALLLSVAAATGDNVQLVQHKMASKQHQFHRHARAKTSKSKSSHHGNGVDDIGDGHQSKAKKRTIVETTAEFREKYLDELQQTLSEAEKDAFNKPVKRTDLPPAWLVGDGACPGRCYTCQAGASRKVGGVCTAHCSLYGYCGRDESYRKVGSTDCTMCKGDEEAASLLETDSVVETDSLDSKNADRRVAELRAQVEAAEARAEKAEHEAYDLHEKLQASKASREEAEQKASELEEKLARADFAEEKRISLTDEAVHAIEEALSKVAHEVEVEKKTLQTARERK